MPGLEQCGNALAEAVSRLDPVLRPLGFTFLAGPSGEGHTPFASGFCVGDAIRIGLVYRRHGTLGSVLYENERSNMSHDDLIRFLGLQNRQQLRYDAASMTSWAACGDDPIDALIFDLRELIEHHLLDRELMDQFIARSLEERFPSR